MSKDHKKLLERIDKRFKAMSDADNDFRLLAVDDIKFVRLGEQWPESVKRDRETPGQERPCLTINRILQFRQQIVNESRQMRPSMVARPVSGGADIDTAEIYEGLLRHIQEASDANVAYDTASEYQIDTGKGYFEITTGYEDDYSFDQEIKIVRIHNMFDVYFDELSTQPDGSDARDAIKLSTMDRVDYDAEYPDIDPTPGLDAESWVTDEQVRIAQYYYIDSTPYTLVQLIDGAIGDKKDLPKEAYHLIAKERKSERKICKICKRVGDTIIEETELQTQFVPIIPVYGNETWVEGKRHLHGLTRFAKDAQRLYNYNQSANTETTALAPKAPFVCAEGQLEGHEQQWAMANRVNYAYLEYKPITDDAGNQVLPPPRREMPPPINPAFEGAMNRSIDDMKATMGIYDASLGNKEADQSGKAILSQQRQASNGNMHFSDNLSRSIKHGGRIIVELIPKIYDTERAIRILGDDGTAKHVQLNPAIQGPNQEQPNQESGKPETVYNLAHGKYDLVIDAGPNYSTKRQEAAENMINLVQKMPQVGQVAGDLIVQELDFPGGQAIAKRLKAILPPQIQQEIQAEEDGDQDPQAAMMMHQMADQMQHLSQTVQQLQSAPDLLRAQADTEQKKIDWFNAQTQRMKVEGDLLDKQSQMVHLMAESDLEAQFKANEQQQAAQAQAHQQEMAEQQQQLSAQAQQQEQEEPAEETAQPTTPGGAQE